MQVEETKSIDNNKFKGLVLEVDQIPLISNINSIPKLELNDFDNESQYVIVDGMSSLINSNSNQDRGVPKIDIKGLVKTKSVLRRKVRKVKAKDDNNLSSPITIGSNGDGYSTAGSSSERELEELLNSPSQLETDYYDAKSSYSPSLPPTPSSSTLILPPDISLPSPELDYFSLRNSKPQQLRSSTLPSIPSSPLPFPTPTNSNQYSNLMLSSSPLPSPSLSNHSSSFESTFFSDTNSSPEIFRTPPIMNYSTSVPTSPTLDKKNQSERRYHSLFELVETETRYLQSLNLLCAIYFQNLALIANLSNSDIELITRNSQILFELHQRIVERLNLVEEELKWISSSETRNDTMEDEVKFREAAGRIAQIYLDELSNFSYYNDFCSRHGEALDLIRFLESSVEWITYTQQCSDLIATNALPFQPKSPPERSVSSSTTSSSTTVNRPTSSHSTSTSTSPLTPTLNRATTSFPNLAKSQSKLRFQDYLIQPIQRICRYPLLFSQILKHLDDCPEKDLVRKAYEAMVDTAKTVDKAKTAREVALRTKTVASRMEFHPAINSAFREVLGPILLISSLHVLHHYRLDPIKIKYYGVFLYQTHLIMVKVKKRDVYEPREWLPLRLFDLVNIEEGEGLMPFSFRIAVRDHHFEVGASCLAEKMIWLNHIISARTERLQLWKDQPLDKNGKPTLYDETVVSSISPIPASNTLPDRAHARSKSVGSITPTSFKMSSYEEKSPVDSTSPTSGNMTVASKNRFSTTASLILGKTPAAQRSAIEFRLSDVASSECVTARAQALREESGRTLSRPNSAKGPNTNGRSGKSVLRRLSLVDGPLELDPALVFDMNNGTLNREDWTSTIKRTIASRRESLEIDTGTILDLSRSKSLSWRSRTLSMKTVSRELSIAKSSTIGSTVDVERNNSTSSQSTTSSGTGHSSIITQATSILDSPSHSVPSSPTFAPTELSNIESGFSRLSRKSSRLSSKSGSSFGLSIPNEEDTSSYVPTSSLSSRGANSRRNSTIGNFFSKRVQSSPALTNIFNPSPPPSPLLSNFSTSSTNLNSSTTSSSSTITSDGGKVISSRPSSSSSSIDNETTESSKINISGSKSTRSKSMRFFFSSNKFTPL